MKINLKMLFTGPRQSKPCRFYEVSALKSHRKIIFIFLFGLELFLLNL